MATQNNQVPGPEGMVYDALADTVAMGILKWITCARAAELSVHSAPQTEVFWDVETRDALKEVANYVATKLQRQGYEISRKVLEHGRPAGGLSSSPSSLLARAGKQRLDYGPDSTSPPQLTSPSSSSAARQKEPPP